jgi:DNA mismatch repair protein MutS
VSPVDERVEVARGAPSVEPTLASVHAFTGLLSPEPVALDPALTPDEPYVGDLNLDQIVDAVVIKREEPDYLRAHLLRQLHDEDSIRFRQEVFSDLEEPGLFAAAQEFSNAMRTVHSHIRQIGSLSHRLQRRGWLLDAAAIYCGAVDEFTTALSAAAPASRALRGLAAYLGRYRESTSFSSLREETLAVKASLDAITYAMRITPGRIDVVRYYGEPDYSAEVEATFERFSQGVVKDYSVRFRGWPGIDRIGGEVLTMVAKLYPEEFAGLEGWCARHRSFIDATVHESERELEFYMAYRNYMDPIRVMGLRFCLPKVSASSKSVLARSTYDLALAAKLISGAQGPVVTNDLELSGPERIIVVSGPNQGGKTTFARTFGQLHHLASIGVPVPGTQATLVIFDQIFTHFEREEDLVRLSGKLEDDLVRIHDILSRATPQSIVVLNEIFTSTALNDARYLGTRIMERIIALDLLCVFVTFVDEMVSMGDSVVSMMSSVVPTNPAERTFKVVRAPADGLAHAWALAEKHHLTYQQIKERLAR